MSNTRYYEAHGEKIKAALRRFLTRTKDAREARYRFSRRVGGKRTTYMETTCGFAIVFSKTPDEKLWRRMKGDGPECWVPRQSIKAGKDIAKEMDALTVPSQSELCRIIEMERFVFDRRGMGSRSAGLELIADRVFIGAPDDYMPIKGLTRISDVAMERIIKNHG
jgi:hypothetical protein